jgi:peptidoglycan/LPS O-acetylase OafA/YrhL
MTALTTIALIMQFSRRLELGGNRWLVLLGAWSMPIYLAHIIFASGFRIVLMKLGIEHTLLHVVGGTLVGIIGPIILYKLSKSMRFTPLFNSPFIKTAH